MIPRQCPRFFSILLPAAFCAGVLYLALPLGAQQDVPDSRPNFRWPMEAGNYPDVRGLTSTFGESRGDHFHNGLDIAGLGDPIYPVADGYIVYGRRAADDPYLPEQGPGNYVFLYHGRGWWSGYYHLKSDPTLARRGQVGEESVIGRAGNTGHSGGAHLHFFVARYSADGTTTILNPLMLLPRSTDTNAPVIGQLAVYTPNGKTLIAHSRPERIRLTQSYPILINVIDPGMERSTRRGIYRLTWELNGLPAQSRVFDEISYNEDVGDWVLQDEYTFPKVFQHGLYNLGELEWKAGKNTLIVSAEDLNGNTASVEFDVTVDREY